MPSCDSKRFNKRSERGEKNRKKERQREEKRNYLSLARLGPHLLDGGRSHGNTHTQVNQLDVYIYASSRKRGFAGNALWKKRWEREKQCDRDRDHDRLLRAGLVRWGLGGCCVPDTAKISHDRQSFLPSPFSVLSFSVALVSRTISPLRSANLKIVSFSFSFLFLSLFSLSLNDDVSARVSRRKVSKIENIQRERTSRKAVAVHDNVKWLGVPRVRHQAK